MENNLELTLGSQKAHNSVLLLVLLLEFVLAYVKDSKTEFELAKDLEWL